tara:strand:+ start:403 stop:894 length:492 start_codon:yes stop_codon:yes gene_type:complete
MSQFAASPKIFFMKNLFTLCAFALCTLTLSAQDDGSSMGAKGTFFLGSGDATALGQLFSDTGMGLAPTVGYCVADDIAIQLSMNGSTDALSMNLAGAYFIDDYYVGARFYDLAGDNLDIGIGGAKIIPFKGPLFVAPGIEYRFGLPDDASDNLGLTIGFGARF